MKRRLFGLQGVKTGGGGEGGGKRERGAGGGMGVGGLFHGHPVKRKRGGWGGITAGVRQRQRFRVVGQRVQEVRETVPSSGPLTRASSRPLAASLFVQINFNKGAPGRGPLTPLVTIQPLPPSISFRMPNLKLMGFDPRRRAGIPFWRIHTLGSTIGPNNNTKVSAERLAPVKPFQREWARPASPLV